VWVSVKVLDIRGIDFVCRICAHCGEDDEYDWEKSIDDQKTFHLLGECGFDITLWSLCGHFVAVLVCGRFGCTPIYQVAFTMQCS